MRARRRAERARLLRRTVRRIGWWWRHARRWLTPERTAQIARRNPSDVKSRICTCDGCCPGIRRDRRAAQDWSVEEQLMEVER
jgi:hypothetical protein